MKRNLKALGLALVAAFAMSAVAASAAQAEDPAEFTAAEYPAVITGHEEGGSANNYFQITGNEGPKTTCENVTYEATLEQGSEKQKELTVTPHYTNCEASGLATTVNLNGCHYKFTAGTYTTTDDVAHGSVHIVCPVGKTIQVTAGGICRTDIGAQTVGGVTYINKAANKEGTPHDWVTISVDTTNDIVYTETDLSFFCPNTNNHTTENGNFVSSVIVKGYADVSNHNDPNTPGTLDYTHSATEIDIDVRATP